MILSCRKASWFSFPRSFPAGKRRGFPFHDPFLQESVVVFLSTILSCRKASWFSFPRSFPAGKRHGFPFRPGKVLSAVLERLGTWFCCFFGAISGNYFRIRKRRSSMIQSAPAGLWVSKRITSVRTKERIPFQTLIAWPEHPYPVILRGYARNIAEAALEHHKAAHLDSTHLHNAWVGHSPEVLFKSA